MSSNPSKPQASLDMRSGWTKIKIEFSEASKVEQEWELRCIMALQPPSPGSLTSSEELVCFEKFVCVVDTHKHQLSFRFHHKRTRTVCLPPTNTNHLPQKNSLEPKIIKTTEKKTLFLDHSRTNVCSTPVRDVRVMGT